MNVLFVTSPNECCGIRVHGEMLKDAISHAAPSAVIFETVGPRVLDGLLDEPDSGYDLIHVNHHAALHSTWARERVSMLAAFQPIVITQHDTFETRALMNERGLPDFSAIPNVQVVTHERVGGYQSHVMRQGVPRVSDLDTVTDPALGTVGFDFPWKNFALLAKVSAMLDLACLIISPGMTDERASALRAINPRAAVVTEWLPVDQVVKLLSMNLANLFLYQNGNSGTSGAIRLGFAAQRPVVALPCRQFRDLDGCGAHKTCRNQGELLDFLQVLKASEGLQLAYASAAQSEAQASSWDSVGRRYWQLYTARGRA